MAKIEVRSQGSSKVYEIDDDLVTIGRDEKNHIRLKDPDAPPFAARLTRKDGQWRVESGEPGRKVSLNGMSVMAGDIEAGDAVKVGGAEIVFHGAEAGASAAAAPGRAAAPEPALMAPRSGGRHGARSAQAAQAPRARSGSASRGHAPAEERGGGRHERSHHGPRKNASNQVGLYSIIATVALALVFIVYKLAIKLGEGTPEEVLAVAQRALKDGDIKGAQDVMTDLERRQIDPRTRDEIAKIRKGIEGLKRRSELQPRRGQAGGEFGIVLNYKTNYFVNKDGTWLASIPREHAREGATITKKWLDKYRDLAEYLPDFAETEFKQAQEIYDKAAQFGKLEEPDNAKDALFRADRLTRLVNKNWRESIVVLDEYLKRDPENKEVKDMRKSRMSQADGFLQDKLTQADEMLAKPDGERMKKAGLENIRDQLQAQLEGYGLEVWAPKLQDKINQLNAALAKM